MTAPSLQLPPWSAAAMRELYRQSRWTRFYEHCLRDRLLFADLARQGMGELDVQVAEGRPCSVFTMAPSWIRGLAVELEAERVALEAA